MYDTLTDTRNYSKLLICTTDGEYVKCEDIRKLEFKDVLFVIHNKENKNNFVIYAKDKPKMIFQDRP